MEERARRSTAERTLAWSCLGLLVLAAACATAPPPVELVQARASYELAAGNPAVVQNAPVDLLEARKSLDRAESAYAEEVDAEELAHLSALAIKRTEIAEAEAQARAAAKEAERLGQLRQRGHYDAQARLADLAAGDAARARAQLDSLTATAARTAATPESAATPSMASIAEAIARLEARLALRDQEVATAAGEQQRRALETMRLAEQTRTIPQRGEVEVRMGEIAAREAAAEQRAQLLQKEGFATENRTREIAAANEAAARRALELDSVNRRAEQRALELTAANEDAERRMRELQTANQAAERAIESIETQNAAVEQQVLELLASLEADERSMLEVQSGLETSARAVSQLATADITEARRQVEESAARAAAERSALESLESKAAEEARQHQALIAEETDALRTLDELAQSEGNVAAARAALERASGADAEVRRAQDLRDEAARRSQALEDENQRLRVANETLLAAVGAPAPSAAAAPAAVAPAAVPPAPAPASGAARDVVVVSDGRDGVSTIERSLVREEPTTSEGASAVPQGELAAALAEERERRREIESLSDQSHAFAVEARETAKQASARAALLERERAELQEWRARLEPGKIVLTLGDLFASGGVEPRAEVLSSLERLAALLEERPGRAIVIEGHTDGAGDRQFNMDLSRRRAEAVRSFLESRGVPGSRMRAAGLGEDVPIAPNNTADGRGRNRRVEVSILDTPVARDPVSG